MAFMVAPHGQGETEQRVPACALVPLSPALGPGVVTVTAIFATTTLGEGLCFPA